MSKFLKLYRSVNLGGAFGLIPKGEYSLGKKGPGGIDAEVTKHWLVKGMLDDGNAVIITKNEESKQKTKSKKIPSRNNQKTAGEENKQPASDPDGKDKDKKGKGTEDDKKPGE